MMLHVKEEPHPLPVQPALPLPATNADTTADGLLLALCSRYVRREQRFYHVDRPNEALSRRDMEQAFLNQIGAILPGVKVTSDILKRVYDLAIEKKHTDRQRSIPVWRGAMACYPGKEERLVWNDTGTVEINTWKVPAYRKLGITDIDILPFGRFLATIFPRTDERRRTVDWLAWSLQNESQKPAWAVLLYSKEKGTGKSTFCELVRCLFGPENTATLNNVDKLTAKFNAMPLTNKMVICEELQLRPESTQSNSVKTFITDKTIVIERKGREAERIPLVSNFLATTNHLPTWLEEGERRWWIVDTGHDGAASGANAAQFSDLVGQVVAAMQDPVRVAKLYNLLMIHRFQPDFNPHSLNTALHSTEIMKRVQSVARQTVLTQLEEFLNREGRKAMTQADVKEYIVRECRMSGNSTRHLMAELGWTQYSVKWGGKDYARAIWARPGYVVADGNIYGKEDKSVEAVCDHLSLAGSE